MKKPLLLASVIVCVGASTGLADLLSLYTFDDTANNAVAGAPNGRLVGAPRYVAGKIGRAISLDGRTQFVDTSLEGFPKASDHGKTKGLWTGSAVFWINTTSSVNGAVLGAINHDIHTAVVLTVNEGYPHGGQIGQLSMYFRSEDFRSSCQVTLASPNNEWRDGKWHQIAMTWGQTVGSKANGYKIYIDGAPQMERSYVQGAGFTPADVFTSWQCPVCIGAAGRMTPMDSYFLDGLLDDVAVFNTQLAPIEVKALFNLANDPVLHYNAKDAGALLEIFAAGPGSAGQTNDGKTWDYVAKLSGKPGDIVKDHTAMILDAAGNGVQVAPSPARAASAAVRGHQSATGGRTREDHESSDSCTCCKRKAGHREPPAA